MSSAYPPEPALSGLQGFILTRQWFDTDTGIELVFWTTTPQGAIRCVIPGQEAVFFVAQKHCQDARRLLNSKKGWRIAPLELKNFDHELVSAVYLSSQKILYEARDILTANGIPVLEGDVNPPDRFLMERFITGGIEILSLPKNDANKLQSCHLQSLEFLPSLTCMSVDIETAYGGNELYSIGAYSEDGMRVFMVGETHRPDCPTFLQFYRDEEGVIEAFLDFIQAQDPDVLLGWNIVNFDLRFLQECCDRLRLKFSLGRDTESVSWRKSRAGGNRYFATVPGRVVLDGIEILRSATYHFESFSLDYVARKILNRGKLIDDVDQRGAEITDLFNTDKVALAEYNLEDCRLVWEIFATEKLVDFALQRSQLTGLEISRYGGSVAAFDFLYLPRLHREGYVAPSIGESDAVNVSPGGYVMNSEPGIYEHIVVLDFKSLYPSIIRTFNVDPLALVVAVNENDAIPGFDGGEFSRTHFLLPDLIKKLWNARDKARSTSNTELSQAIKIIMNSFYGVLGTRGCRFYDPRLVSSITKRGHQIIIDSKKYIEDHGYRVIYGDTDSLFVLVTEAESGKVEHLARDLASNLNRWWTEKLKSELGINSCLEIEFETHYHKFLMPMVRGTEKGSKKRYAGMVRSKGNSAEFDLIFKGLESVRSDWSLLARRFQRRLYELIFKEEPYQEFILHTTADLFAGRLNSELILRRRLRRGLHDYVKNIPPHVQAARKLEIFRSKKGLPALYDQGGWIEYLMTVNGPEPRQSSQSAMDYNFYLERQIAPIADSILIFKSTSIRELLDKQIALF